MKLYAFLWESAAADRDDLAGSHSHKGGLIADKTMQRALSR
jgi:hypothetical protein